MSNIRAVWLYLPNSNEWFDEWLIRKVDHEGRKVSVFKDGEWAFDLKLNHLDHWFVDMLPQRVISALDWLAKDGGFA